MAISDAPFAFYRHTCEGAVQRLNEALGGRGVLVEKKRKSCVCKVWGWDLNPTLVAASPATLLFSVSLESGSSKNERALIATL